MQGRTKIKIYSGASYKINKSTTPARVADCFVWTTQTGKTCRMPEAFNADPKRGLHCKATLCHPIKVER